MRPLTSFAVTVLFNECLRYPGEEKRPFILVEGMQYYVFDRSRIEAAVIEIDRIAEQLPHSFFTGKGAPFSEFIMTRNGVPWTRDFQQAERLLALMFAAKKAAWSEDTDEQNNVPRRQRYVMVLF